MNEPGKAEEPVNPRHLAEFACWTMVTLAPMLTWVNGPSVSTDQFVVRTAVFLLALTGGLALTTMRLLRRHREKPNSRTGG